MRNKGFSNGLNVELAGNITKGQKREIAEGIIKILEEVTNKPPSATYVVIEEVDRENWAESGKLLADK